MEYKSTNHILKLPSIGYIMLALRITILALRNNFSGLNNSNVNKVIRAVLKSFFFYEKNSHAPKAQNATSEQKWKMHLKTSKGKKVTY